MLWLNAKVCIFFQEVYILVSFSPVTHSFYTARSLSWNEDPFIKAGSSAGVPKFNLPTPDS
jgi:hypothetical protein